jgi:hypothetical protein
MQAKYMSSTKSRTKVIFIQEYLLINFDEYKFFDQVIYLETLNGELIERFYKKEYHKMDPVTKSPIVDPNQVVIPIRKSKDKPKKKAEPVEPVAEDPLPVVDKNEFTIRDVMDIVRVPYDNQTEEFKAYYFPPEFEDYVTLNKIIDERFPRIRSSRYQLTMAQFVELMSDYAPTQKELQDTFIKISGLGIKQDMSIGDRMIDCLTNWIRKPSAAPDQRDEHAPVAGENGIDGNYVRDEKFEKRVLDLWGMGESKYHQSHALVKGFCLSLYNQNQLDHFKHQFGFYEQVHLINGKYNFGFEKFLGNQKVLFSDGKWCSANWEQTYKDKTATNGSAKNGNTNTEHKSGVEHSETSHISFMSKIKGGN